MTQTLYAHINIIKKEKKKKKQLLVAKTFLATKQYIAFYHTHKNTYL
jgi:hypothetical protein